MWALIVERVAGIEPALSAWKAEVLPLNYTRISIRAPRIVENLISCIMVEGEGFEPSKVKPSDLQSDPFGRSGTPPTNKASIVSNVKKNVNSFLKKYFLYIHNIKKF